MDGPSTGQYQRSRTLLRLANLVLVAATLPMLDRVDAPGWGLALWLAALAAVTVASEVRRLEAPLRRYGPFVVLGLVLVLVLLTGGHHSPYAALYLPVVGFAAAVHDTRSFTAILVVGSVLFLVPAALEGSRHYLAAATVAMAAGAAALVVVHRIARDGREAGELYLSVLRHHRGPTYVLSPEGALTWVNDAAERVLGRRRDEVVGTPWVDVMATGEAERLQRGFERALAGEPQPLSVVIEAGSGRHHLRGTLFPVRRGGTVTELMGITEDITPETRAVFGAAALRRVIGRLSLPMAVLDCHERTWRYANPAAVELVGGEEDAELGWDLVPPPVRDLATVEVSEVRQVAWTDPRGRRWEFVVHAMRQDRDLLAFAAVDLTERERREAALRNLLERERESVERLRHLDEVKGAFLSATSHELRTPLTIVLGAARTLARHGEVLGAEDRQQLRDALEAQADHLDRLLRDLLDVDRLVRGATTTLPKELDVAALVRQVVRGRPGVVLRVPERHVARVDPARLQRIVELLLDNAERHAPGAPVEVRLGGQDGGALVLEVADRGPGIPGAEREQVFEPFHRLDLASADPGAGVGLALVAEFARAHGGHAEAVETPGGGTTISVVLRGDGTGGAGP